METAKFENIIDSDELERARKKAKRREWRNRKILEAQNFYHAHHDEILIIVPAAAALLTTCVKVGGKQIKLAKEKNLKENYCYDRSLGHYWALRRNPSNAEWLEIDRRKRNGERLADILEDLRLLK